MLLRENASRGFGTFAEHGRIVPLSDRLACPSVGTVKLISEVISPEVSFGDRVELREDILERES